MRILAINSGKQSFERVDAGDCSGASTAGVKAHWSAMGARALFPHKFFAGNFERSDLEQGMSGGKARTGGKM
jgi:hypothetical protein